MNKSKIKISEFFFSIQGEGRFVGVASVFLRTFGCNFTCGGFGMPKGEKSTEADTVAKNIKMYHTLEELPLVKTGCDSYAAWHPKFKHLSPTQTIDEIVAELLVLLPNRRWLQPNGNDVHLVVTGGEPLLGWQRAYGDLLAHKDMRDLKNITFETNGTQTLSEDFVQAWAQSRKHTHYTFSVSPKLSVSGEKWEEAICPAVVASYENFGHVYLKFVVSSEDDLDEAEQAVAEYRAAGFTGPVYAMPVGGVSELYDETKFSVARAAMRRGWHYSPRLHIDILGNAWGA